MDKRTRRGTAKPHLVVQIDIAPDEAQVGRREVTNRPSWAFFHQLVDFERLHILHVERELGASRFVERRRACWEWRKRAKPKSGCNREPSSIEGRKKS